MITTSTLSTAPNESAANLTPVAGRTDVGSLRARVAAARAGDGSQRELRALAVTLMTALECSRAASLQLQATHAELVAACRASVAAAWLGQPAPLVHVEHQLAAHGWLPTPGSRPSRLLAADVPGGGAVLAPAPPATAKRTAG